jgi:hypothetical protein
VGTGLIAAIDEFTGHFLDAWKGQPRVHFEEQRLRGRVNELESTPAALSAILIDVVPRQP